MKMNMMMMMMMLPLIASFLAFNCQLSKAFPTKMP
jgi:hypothetical protein